MAGILEKLRRMSPGPRRFAAVDFDSRQLRIVHAERVGGRTRILKLAAVAMPQGIDVEDARAVGQLLARTLADMRLTNVGVLMNVGRAEAVLKPVTLPPGTDEGELANMVQFQVEKELPFRPEEAVIDFTVESHYDVGATQGTDTPTTGIDVLVGAAKLPVVAHYRQIAEEAKVRLLRLGLRSYANLRCIDACTRRAATETLLLVHLGTDETEIDMLVGNSLSFSRSAAVKIPPPEDPSRRGEIVQTIVMEVARSVQSYQAVERASRIDGVLVAGGTGFEALAAEGLAERLGVPCELFDPAAALGLGEVANPSAFISALGLAIGHQGADQLPFDFLNPKRPRVRHNWAKIAGIAIAAGVVLALAGGVTAGSIYLGGKRAVVDDLREKYNEAKTAQKNLVRLKKRVDSIREWKNKGRDWLAHWAYLSSLMPSCADVYITGLKTSADGAMKFTVKARESKMVTDLGSRLTEAGYRFQPGRLAAANDPFGYPYSADVVVLSDSRMAVALESVKPIPRPQDDDSANRLMRMAARQAQAKAGATAAGARPAGVAARPAGLRGGRPGPPPGPVASAAPAVAPVAAKPTPPGGPNIAALQALRQEILAQFDVDRDGKLGGREYRNARKLFYSAWKPFDLNGDGKMSSSERNAMSKFRHDVRDGKPLQ